MSIELVALDDEIDVEVLYQHFFAQEISKNKVRFSFYSDPLQLICDFPKLKGEIFLLTDMQMPAMNGLEVIEKLKELRSDYQVFIISAKAIELSDHKKEFYHIKEIMLKPLNFTVLREKVLEYL